MSRRRRAFDYHLFVLVTLGLVAFGLVMVYSASSARATLAADDPAYYLKRQALYALVGIAALVLFSRTDYRRLRFAILPLLLTSFAFLVAVLVVYFMAPSWLVLLSIAALTTALGLSGAPAD